MSLIPDWFWIDVVANPCSCLDITDRFDHTFLFGDLNFRLDITRKHADWLMIQKSKSHYCITALA